MHKDDIRPEKACDTKSAYPPPHGRKLEGRRTWVLTGQWKLTQFGANRDELPPGAWSAAAY